MLWIDLSGFIVITVLLCCSWTTIKDITRSKHVKNRGQIFDHQGNIKEGDNIIECNSTDDTVTNPLTKDLRLMF